MRNLILVELDDVELAQLRAIASINNVSSEAQAAKLITDRIGMIVDAEFDELLSGGEHV